MSDRRAHPDHAYIGQPVRRIEDARLLTGAGRYVDDLKLPGMAAMAILRSPHAHARIAGVDLSAARELPGVIDVFAAAEVAAAFGGELPLMPLRLAPFEGFERFRQAPIAADKVRFVGEPVAVVVAGNRYVAEDALDLIDVDYAPLAALPDVGTAAADAVLLHEAAGTNLATSYSVGRGDIDAAFAGAAYTRRETFTTNRHGAVPMETRGLVAEYDGATLRLHGATKVAFYNRNFLAGAFGLEPSAVELIETDIGGGFGARGELYPEDFLVPVASRRAGRPVKWIEDRRENLMACNHSREIVCELEIAADADGRIRGLRGTLTGDMGAYIRTNGGVAASKAVQFLPGPYRVPAFACEMRALVTTKTPVGTFRGPGRFEANFCRERLIDLMAADLGLDPAETRLQNLMTPDELPFRIGELVPGDPDATYDAGDYPAAFRRLLQEVDARGWRARIEGAGDGRRRGIGFGCFVESSAGGPPETARVTVATDGAIEIRTGASGNGQGVETSLAQVCGEILETGLERMTVLHGSTTLLPSGGGTFHSRNAVMAGNAVRVAAEAVRARCRELAALRWNAAVDDAVYSDGGVHHATDDTLAPLSLADLAGLAEAAGAPLAADGSFDNEGKSSFSYGGHAALVAIDVATGEIAVERYVLVEEIGRALNPALVRGQAVGGLVQGLGGTLYDHMVYDSDGQLLTGSFADYLLPVAGGLPEITAIALEDYPSQLNPMGFKGAGEGGIVAVAAAVANAVAQALAPYGIAVDTLPLTPERLRTALRAAGH